MLQPIRSFVTSWTAPCVSGRRELAGSDFHRRIKRALQGTHNNAAERALRGPVLSRKNFLFAGADSGDERAAVLYTLLETAKLNDLDPEAYLRFVLERIAEHPISNALDELLPWAVASLLAGAEPRLAA